MRNSVTLLLAGTRSLLVAAKASAAIVATTATPQAQRSRLPRDFERVSGVPSRGSRSATHASGPIRSWGSKKKSAGHCSPPHVA